MNIPPLGRVDRGVRNFQRDRVSATVVLRSEENLRAADRTHGAELYRLAVAEADNKRCPDPEVAEEPGVPAGTLRNRTLYGVRALRFVLQEMGWAP